MLLKFKEIEDSKYTDTGCTFLSRDTFSDQPSTHIRLALLHFSIHKPIL
jgi:hypothetical protein